jgi:hypothetical protein
MPKAGAQCEKDAVGRRNGDILIPFPVRSYFDAEPQTVQVVRQGESTKEGADWKWNDFLFPDFPV